MNLLELIEPNIDEFGLIAQTNGDGGDTLQREGMFIFAAILLHKKNIISLNDLVALKYRFWSSLSLLEQKGLLRRHSDPTKWYSNWDRCSRDQYHAIIGISMSMFGNTLGKILFQRAKRLFLFMTNIRGNGDSQNLKFPDFTGPETWALEIRGASYNGSKVARCLSILLPILDISLTLQSLIWQLKFRFVKDDVDILNHLQSVLFANTVRSTFAAKIAKKLMPKSECKRCLDEYFSPANQGVQGLAVIYKTILDHYDF